MSDEKIVAALVTGGEANAGPPLGPALGPLGVNVVSIVNAINEATKDYLGMMVPVKIIIDTETKQFNVTVGTPTTSALIAKESGIPKGSGSPKEEMVGDLKMDQVVKVAKAKMDQSYASSIKSAAKEVIGSCVSMGVRVEGQDPREILVQISDGKWDSSLVG